MNDDNSPMGGDPTDNFIRSNTIKIPAVLALGGTDAVAAVAGTITNPVRIPVRIDYGQSSQAGRAAADDTMRETQTMAPPSPLASRPGDDESDADRGGSMAPRRRRR